MIPYYIPIIELSRHEIYQIRVQSHRRGMRAGLLIGFMFAILASLTTYAIMSTRLTDEARATNYYYQLSNTK